MYDPAFVFPYQRSPGQWYTLLAVFTQSRPVFAPPLRLEGVVLAVEVEEGEAGLVGVAAVATAYVSTPTWPRHAPLRVFPDHVLPSLHVAVTAV